MTLRQRLCPHLDVRWTALRAVLDRDASGQEVKRRIVNAVCTRCDRTWVLTPAKVRKGKAKA